MNIPQEIIEEAKERKEFANKAINNPDWMAKACEISKEAMKRYREQTVEQIAKNSWDYLRMRANATGECWGTTVFIDKSARAKYLRLTGEA